MYSNEEKKLGRLYMKNIFPIIHGNEELQGINDLQKNLRKQIDQDTNTKIEKNQKIQQLYRDFKTLSEKQKQNFPAEYKKHLQLLHENIIELAESGPEKN